MSPINSQQNDGFCSLDDVPVCEMESLWPQRLYLGTLAILDGDPGLGKSHLTLDIAARATKGREFPDGSAGSGPANVVILNGDDRAGPTVRPRLARFGADLTRVFMQTNGHDSDDARLTFPSSVAKLDAVLVRTDARLVVIDPVLAFLDPGVNTSSDQSVRRALVPLVKVAEQRRCAIWLVRHLNKSVRARALYRGGGSIGFHGACRSAYLVAADPHNPRRKVFAEVKNNYAERQPSLGYKFTPRSDATPFQWLGFIARQADDLLRGIGKSPRCTARALAQQFLSEHLKHGARTLKETRDHGLLHGFTFRTIKRAKDDLKLTSIRVRTDSGTVTYWLLPGQSLPETIPTTAIIWDPGRVFKSITQAQPARCIEMHPTVSE